MPSIETIELGRRFGNVWALRDVSISVDSGEVASLLGPNGAGKTTLVRILSTELAPSSGAAYVLGMDVVRQADKVRRRIAVIPQEAKPIGFLTPREFVQAYLLLRGFSIRDARRMARVALEKLELWDYRDEQIYNLSSGFKRRVLVAAVLASNADVIFLDEPTTGLDPIARRQTWNAIIELAKTGATVLLTTHYVEEAEALSTTVFILDRGRVVARGSPRELTSKVPGSLRVEILCSEGPMDGYVRLGDRLVYHVDESTARDLVEWAVSRGYHVLVKQKGLEDVIIRLVGRWE